MSLKVWELASGGGAKLNRMQFAAAMSLVALAQVRCILHTRRVHYVR